MDARAKRGVASGRGAHLVLCALVVAATTTGVLGSAGSGPSARAAGAGLAASAAGTLSTIAGGYVPGRQAATTVGISPKAVAEGPGGDLYVADSSYLVDHSVVRMVSPSGAETVVAGGGAAPATCTGSADALGDGCAATQAQLSNPGGLAVDSAGDLIVSDTFDDVVRLVAAADCSSSCPFGLASTTAGDIYDIAGNGSAGYSGDGGPAAAAELSRPEGVTVDSAGNLLIADYTNSVVRMVAATNCSSGCAYGLASTTIGDIYTVAGDGTFGFTGDGGPALSAQLQDPDGVAVDSGGDLVISDSFNNRVRLVAAAACVSACAYGLSSTTAGYIYTVAGDGTTAYSGTPGPAVLEGLDLPGGIALDGSGDIVIADTNDNAVQVVAAATCSSACAFGLGSTTAGYLYTVAGTGGTAGYSGAGGPATAAQLAGPAAVAVDSSGNLVVADTGNARVRLLAAGDCSSSCPLGLPSTTAGDLYDVAGNGTLGFSGDAGPATAAELYDPAGIALGPLDEMAVADSANDVVRIVAGASCSTGCPFALATVAGDIYTIAGDGAPGYSGDGGPATAAGLDFPDGVAFDRSGDLLIADTNDNRVRMVAASSCASSCPYGLSSTTAGDIYTVAGDGTVGYSGDGGPATSAEMWNPESVTVDAGGDLLVAETGNDVVRMVAAASCSTSCPYGLSSITAGDIYTVAGDGSPGYGGDGGPGTSAELSSPEGLALDAAGDLLVADTGNDVIRMLAATTCSAACAFGLSSTTAGDIYTVAGDGSSGFSGDGGPALSAELQDPEQLAVDASGDLYISDSSNSRLRMVAAATCSSSCLFGLSSTTAGDIYTIAGDGTAGHTGDGGPATAAELSDPRGIAVDGADDVFLADSTDDVVQAVASGLPSTPAAPVSVSATGGVAAATISWTAPSWVGAEPITSYTVTPYVGATARPASTFACGTGAGEIDCSASPISATVGGLADGTTYTFTVTADNYDGAGIPSQASNAVTTAAVPSAPSSVSAGAGPTSTPGDGKAVLSWPAAGANGAPVTSYTVTPSPACPACSGLVTSGATATTVAGLRPGTAYTFTVKAANVVGTGPASGASTRVLPTTVPGAPRISSLKQTPAGTIELSVTPSAVPSGLPVRTFDVVTSPGCPSCKGLVLATSTTTITGLTKGVRYTFSVRAADTDGWGPLSPPTAPLLVRIELGYWLVTSTGEVFGAGAARSLGSMATNATNPVVGIAGTPDGGGYVVVTRNGTVAAFGDASYHGDLPSLGVRVSNIVAIAETADGRGYWLLGADGGFFAFGDAKYRGSLPGIGVHVSDVVAMTASPVGIGYWIGAANGAVWNFGAAGFHGDLPDLNVKVDNIRSMLPSATGEGYVLVGADGGAFVFGSGVRFYGSLPGRHIKVDDIVGLAITPDDEGYFMAGANGAAYGFGDAIVQPEPVGLPSHLPVAAIAGV